MEQMRPRAERENYELDEQVCEALLTHDEHDAALALSELMRRLTHAEDRLSETRHMLRESDIELRRCERALLATRLRHGEPPEGALPI